MSCPDPLLATATLEDRSAPRQRVRMPATLRLAGDRGFAVVVHDISESGFACEALVRMRPGQRVFLTLPGLSPVSAQVVRHEASFTACAFDLLIHPAVLASITARFACGE